MEEQKKYGIFRIEKIKLCDGGEAMGRLKHSFREFKNDSFDPELTEKNIPADAVDAANTEQKKCYRNEWRK